MHGEPPYDIFYAKDASSTSSLRVSRSRIYVEITLNANANSGGSIVPVVPKNETIYTTVPHPFMQHGRMWLLPVLEDNTRKKILTLELK